MANSIPLIVLLRELYLRKGGILSTTDLIPLTTAYEVELNALENYLKEIIADLPPKKNVVLPFKEVSRFLLLQKAIESKNTHPVYQAIAPYWDTLKENFRKADLNVEESLQAIQSIREGAAPFSEKVPKLVNALNEYAALCEKYYASAASLKRLRINIRLEPLAKEALSLVEQNKDSITTQVYWSIAEELYANNQVLFKENLYCFSIIRAFLDEAISSSNMEMPLIELPNKLIINEPEEIEDIQLPNIEETSEEEEITSENEEVPEPEKVEELEKPEEEPVAESEEEITEETTPEEEPLPDQPEPEVVKTEVEEETPEPIQEEPTTVPEPEEADNLPPSPPISDEAIPQQKKSSKKTVIIIIAVITVILIALAIGFWFIPAPSKPTPTPFLPPVEQPTPPVEIKDSIPANDSIQEQQPTEVPVQPVQEKPVKPAPVKQQPVEQPTPKPQTPEPSGNTSFDALLKKANAGNADAQYKVGQCYEKGDGVTANKFDAITWYRKAKAGGSKEAEKRLLELGY